MYHRASPFGYITCLMQFLFHNFCIFQRTFSFLHLHTWLRSHLPRLVFFTNINSSAGVVNASCSSRIISFCQWYAFISFTSSSITFFLFLMILKRPESPRKNREQLGDVTSFAEKKDTITIKEWTLLLIRQ